MWKDCKPNPATTHSLSIHLFSLALTPTPSLPLSLLLSLFLHLSMWLPGDLIAVMEMSFFIIGFHLNVFLFEYLPFQFVITFVPSIVVAFRVDKEI